MPSVACTNCGAALSPTHLGCPYCGALLVPDRTLEPRQVEELTLLAQNMEAKLRTLKDALDGVVIATFCASGVALVAGYFLMARAGVGLGARIGVELLLLFLAVMLIGWVVGVTETRALARGYEGQIKQEIEAFLLMHGLYRTEFDTTAGKALAPDAALRRFLFEKPARLPPPQGR